MSITTCPNCKAEIQTNTIICEYCDTEIKVPESSHGKLLEEIEKKLIAAEESVSAKDQMWVGTSGIINKKVAIIQNCSVPNNKNDLIKLFSRF